jgi:hypothetical protein
MLIVFTTFCFYVDKKIRLKDLACFFEITNFENPFRKAVPCFRDLKAANFDTENA